MINLSILTERDSGSATDLYQACTHELSRDPPRVIANYNQARDVRKGRELKLTNYCLVAKAWPPAYITTDVKAEHVGGK